MEHEIPKWKKTFIETKQINNLIYNFPDIPEKSYHLKKYTVYISYISYEHYHSKPRRLYYFYTQQGYIYLNKY